MLKDQILCPAEPCLWPSFLGKVEESEERVASWWAHMKFSALSLLGKQDLPRLAEGLHGASHLASPFQSTLFLPAWGLGGQWDSGCGGIKSLPRGNLPSLPSSMCTAPTPCQSICFYSCEKKWETKHMLLPLYIMSIVSVCCAAGMCFPATLQTSMLSGPIPTQPADPLLGR